MILCVMMCRPGDTVNMTIIRYEGNSVQRQDIVIKVEVGIVNFSMEAIRKLKRQAMGLVDRADLSDKFDELFNCDLASVKSKVQALEDEIRRRSRRS